MLTREQMLATSVRRYLDVPFPESDDFVRIQSLSSKERAVYELWFRSRDGKSIPARLPDARIRLMVSCVVDEAGKPMFTIDDLPDLREMDAAITERIYSAAWDHCGFDSEVTEAEENFDEASA